MTAAHSEERRADRPPMLLMRGVSKAFGRVRVLNGVDRTLASGAGPGRRGEDGAG